jgi:CDP-diacylglycerol--glycerol-3-phosphate 3-phosphatidyltransferase
MSQGKDFAALRESGEATGSSHAIGSVFVRWRGSVGRSLLRIGATPNRITFVGFLLILGTAGCLLVAASHHAPWDGRGIERPASLWLPLGLVFFFLSCACDMLDGEVARAGNLGTPFGGILDSTLDRFSDIAIFLACAVHFAMIGNVTLVALAILAMCNGYMISYVKARAEDIIDDCSVGWWQRGERCFGVLVALSFCHFPAFVWQQAISPFFTVMRRILYARGVLRARATGGPMPVRGPLPGVWRYIALWRHPRGSIGYDLSAAFNIGFIIAAPWVHPFFYGASDPLRDLLVGIR